MEMPTPTQRPTRLVDWSKPQRQPWAGFLITTLQALKTLLRILWPVLVVRLFNSNESKPGRNTLFFLFFGGMLVVLSLILGFLRRHFFRFLIINGELQVRTGWISKKVLTIPLERIQSVEIEADLMHQLFGLVKVQINTAGTSKTEATIDALRRPMAEALRDELLQDSAQNDTNDQASLERPAAVPVLKLSGYDLVRLSLTANHLEAFVLLLTFGWGLYDDLRPVAEKFFPGREELAAAGFKAIMLLGIFIVVATLVYSTLRTLLRYFDYTVLRNERGFALRFGLLDRRQRLVPFEKIQFLKWHANWLRRRFGLWILDLGVVGEEELKRKQQLSVPLTDLKQVTLIADAYYSVPQAPTAPLQIHPSFTWRRTLIVGLLPVLPAVAVTCWLEGWSGLLWLCWTLLSALLAYLRQRKFRAWFGAEALYLRGGFFGESFTLLKWYKIQSVTISQSPYQRSHALASVSLTTAAGKIKLPWIAAEDAHAIADYALYQVESNQRVWM